MKANELMIGDWVYSKSVPSIPLRVSDVNNAVVYFKHSCIWNFDEKRYKRKEQFSCVDDSDIESIPLTPEILEKNGFRKDDETDQWYFKSDDRLDMGRLAVGIDDGCGVGLCVMRNGAITYYCKYVHELQHYLRLIGGAEEIIL